MAKIRHYADNPMHTGKAAKVTTAGRRRRQIVVGVWGATAVFLAVAWQVHPHANVNVELTTSEVTLPLSTSDRFDTETWKEFHGNRLQTVSAEGTPFRAEDAETKRAFTVQSIDSDFGSCTFRGVRVSDLQLEEPGTVAFISSSSRDGFTMAPSQSRIKVAVAIPEGMPSECTGFHLGDESFGLLRLAPAGTGNLSLSLRSASDTRLNFVNSGTADVQPEQVLSTLRLSGEVRVASEETVQSDGAQRRIVHGSIVKSPSGLPNDVTFDDIGKPLELKEGDILIIHPEPGQCYVRSLQVRDGFLRLSIQGKIADILIGSGPGTLSRRMPNLFDHLNANMRFFGALPALVGIVITIFEKAGILKK